MHELNIREYRLRECWSQEELATRSGVSQSEISYIESLEKSPAINIIEKLGDALGVCPHDLVKFNHSCNCKWDCNK